MIGRIITRGRNNGLKYLSSGSPPPFPSLSSQFFPKQKQDCWLLMKMNNFFFQIRWVVQMCQDFNSQDIELIIFGIVSAVQWRIQGRGPGGLATPGLIFNQNEAWRDEKNIFGGHAPRYLRVWMTAPLPSSPLSEGLDLPLLYVLLCIQAPEWTG